MSHVVIRQFSPFSIYLMVFVTLSFAQEPKTFSIPKPLGNSSTSTYLSVEIPLPEESIVTSDAYVRGSFSIEGEAAPLYAGLTFSGPNNMQGYIRLVGSEDKKVFSWEACLADIKVPTDSRNLTKWTSGTPLLKLAFYVKFTERQNSTLTLQSFELFKGKTLVKKTDSSAAAASQEDPRFGFPTNFELDSKLFAKIPNDHPKLFFREQDFVKYKKELTSSYAYEWKILKLAADRAVSNGAPLYKDKEDWSGKEQLWQRDVGNNMPILALAYKFTGDKDYLNTLAALAKASCEYPTWGLGSLDGTDLATSHQLFGLAVTYDWCQADLTPEQLTQIKKTLTKRTSEMFTLATNKKAWWHRAFLQNHLWNNAMGMASAGFALSSEEPDSKQWLGFALERWRKTIPLLGEDGASHEGEPYWEYGIEALHKFMVPAKELLGIDLFQNAWFSNNTLYALQMSLPRNSWTKTSSVLDFADSPRSHWYGPDHTLFLYGKLFRDPVAQYLAYEVEKAEVTAPSSIWLNFVYKDLNLAPKSPEGIVPTSKHFSDIGIAVSRTSWSGDEALLAFKCGPALGSKIAELKPPYDLGTGHVHPDANHFTLFGSGDMLLCDDGYAQKLTANHNTLLIDGKGQLGEGKMWFDSSSPELAQANPKLTKVSFGGKLDYLIGDATSGYPQASKLKQYKRHLLFVKPDTLVVLDDIAVYEPKDLELRFFPEAQTFQDSTYGTYLFPGSNSLLRYTPLASDKAEVKIVPTPRIAREGKNNDRLGIRILAPGQTAWRNLSAFTWSSKEKTPLEVSLVENSQVVKIKIGTQVLTVNTKAETATLQ